MMAVKNNVIATFDARNFVDRKANRLVKANASVQQQHGEHHAIDDRRGEQVNRAIA